MKVWGKLFEHTLLVSVKCKQKIVCGDFESVLLSSSDSVGVTNSEFFLLHREDQAIVSTVSDIRNGKFVIFPQASSYSVFLKYFLLIWVTQRNSFTS